MILQLTLRPADRRRSSSSNGARGIIVHQPDEPQVHTVCRRGNMLTAHGGETRQIERGAVKKLAA